VISLFLYHCVIDARIDEQDILRHKATPINTKRERLREIGLGFVIGFVCGCGREGEGDCLLVVLFFPSFVVSLSLRVRLDLLAGSRGLWRSRISLRR